MKCFAILLICAFILSAGAQNEWCLGNRLKGVFHRCGISHKVGQAEIQRYVYGDFAHSQNEKCFRACTMIECHYYNSDGSLKHDTPHRLAYKVSIGDPSKYDLIKKIAINCLQATPLFNNVCETSEAYYKCVVGSSPVKLSLEHAF